MNYATIVSQIESLPPLSDTALIVRGLYDEGAENVDVRKLIKAIESDALLTANILKMINSPLYGFSKQIVSVSQAVTLFGTELVFGLVVRYSINATIIANLRPYGRSNDIFNEICHIQSSLINQWYSKIDSTDAQFLTPLALIMESGKLILAKEITLWGNIKNFSEGLKNAKSIPLYENSLFDTSSYYVSGLLFEHWNLNSLYVDILKGLDFEHESFKHLVHYVNALDIVRTAVNVKEVFSDKSIQEASDMVSDLDLDVDHFISVVKNIKESTKERTI
jgi:HD-like signal output (HDOD) protein